MSRNISKQAWNEILDILKKYKIPYTTHYEHRDVQRPMECPDVTVDDLHVHINLIIPDVFDDLG